MEDLKVNSKNKHLGNKNVLFETKGEINSDIRRLIQSSISLNEKLNENINIINGKQNFSYSKPKSKIFTNYKFYIFLLVVIILVIVIFIILIIYLKDNKKNKKNISIEDIKKIMDINFEDCEEKDDKIICKNVEFKI